MDLLDSILGSMDKPPSLSENEKKVVKEFKAKKELEEEDLRKWRNKFKIITEEKIGAFLEDINLRRLPLPPAEKMERSIIHEVAEAAGVVTYSFGMEGEDKHMVLFKKEYPPSENELKALRNGQVYDPSKDEDTEDDSCSGKREQPHTAQGDKYGIPFDYQVKYRKLLGSMDCAEKSAVRLEPNKLFGYVPSANKRDLRSIEQTLNDMKSRKKPKLDPASSSDETSSAT